MARICFFGPIPTRGKLENPTKTTKFGRKVPVAKEEKDVSCHFFKFEPPILPWATLGISSNRKLKMHKSLTM